jgi:hypothetical protein
VLNTSAADSGSAQPARRHVVDGVEITATNAGLRLKCLDCAAVELVLLEQERFNDHVEAFLASHPLVCLLNGRGGD